jgi:hypothetical protein
MMSSTDSVRVSARSSKAHSPLLTTRISIVILVVAYLPLALTFSFLTRAYEGNDEGAHTQYIEYIVRHDSIPPINIAISAESQEPALYYLLAAGWQQLLGIPAFTPHIVLAKPVGPNRLLLNHDYNSVQHQDAIYVHELRLLSILLGLGTVLLTYASAKVIGLREPMALCSALFVALLPRELAVSSNVTNDALAIPLCALALLLFLLSERARGEERLGHRRIYLACMGLTLGAAATTKFTSLPLAAVLLLLALIPSVKVTHPILSPSSVNTRSGSTPRLAIDLRLMVDGAIAVMSFVAASAWWFIRNKSLYGQFLATKASEKSLGGFFAHPVPWSTHIFFVQLPHVLLETTWYAQIFLMLPTWTNDVLAVLGLLCLAVGAWVLIVSPHGLSSRMHTLSSLALLGSISGALAAEVIHIKTTSIGDARLAFVCLTALGIVLVVGSVRLLRKVNPRLELAGVVAWPIVFLVLDIYVLARFLIPLGGL